MKRLQYFLLMCCIPFFLVWPTASNPADNDIKIVITAAFVSERGLPVYEEIADYLSRKLQRSVKIVSGTSYEESDLLLQKGIVQIGFVCGFPYTQKSAEGYYSLVATPVMAMKVGTYPDAKGYEDIPGKYYSYTIVRKDSPIQNWQQLKGKTYAFSDQNSNSGYNMPRYKLIQLGARSWEEYFSKIVVSGSHEESIRLVAEGVVDASSVDSLVLDYDRYIGNKYAMNVKIIEHLFPGGAGAPPVVISSRADPSLLYELQQVLVNMHKDEEGKRILEKALISRFIIGDDDNYNDIRKMDKAAHDAGFHDFNK